MVVAQVVTCAAAVLAQSTLVSRRQPAQLAYSQRKAAVLCMTRAGAAGGARAPQGEGAGAARRLRRRRRRRAGRLRAQRRQRQRGRRGRERERRGAAPDVCAQLLCDGLWAHGGRGQPAPAPPAPAAQGRRAEQARPAGLRRALALQGRSARCRDACLAPCPLAAQWPAQCPCITSTTQRACNARHPAEC